MSPTLLLTSYSSKCREQKLLGVSVNSSSGIDIKNTSRVSIENIPLVSVEDVLITRGYYGEHTNY